MARKRSKYCPYRRACADICYGSQSCDFAIAFDELAGKLERQRRKVVTLEAKLEQAEQALPDSRICGEYVLSPCRNAFNGKMSWWISKKDCTIAMYCFTAMSEKDVDEQLSGENCRAYIKMFEEVMR